MEYRYRFNRLSNENINQEITRLGELLDKQETTYQLKLFMSNLVPTKSKQAKECLSYYEILIDFLKYKRRFWSQHRDNSMDKNALDMIQEKLDLWLDIRWKYLGMKYVKEESADAKEEFIIFKLIYQNTPKKVRRTKKNKK